MYKINYRMTIKSDKPYLTAMKRETPVTLCHIRRCNSNTDGKQYIIHATGATSLDYWDQKHAFRFRKDEFKLELVQKRIVRMIWGMEGSGD